MLARLGLLALLFVAGCHRDDAFRGEPPPPDEPESASVPALAAPPACARRAPGQGAVPLAAPVTGSTIALARAGKHLVAYVADDDERALRTVDIDDRKELSRVDLDGRPSALILAPDGRIVVALRDRGALQVFEPPTELSAPPMRLCAVTTPAEPVSLAVTPDGSTLLVASRWAHALTALGMEALDHANVIDLPRDPQAVIASADGTKALVSHVAGSVVSVVDLGGAAASPRAISTHVSQLHSAVLHFMPMMGPGGKSKSSRVVSQRHERFGTQGYALARTASGRILLPEVTVETGPTTGIAGGYGNSTMSPTVLGDVSILDAAREAVTITPFRGDLGAAAGCLLPRAAALDAVGGELLVACLGTDSVIAWGSDGALPHNDYRRRWVVAPGPMGIAVDEEGRRAVVFSQFEGALDVLDLGMPREKGGPRVDLSKPLTGMRIALARNTPLDPALALGRTIFHEAGGRRLASDGRACASCHPDGRDDALTWSTPDGPRQTPMLVERLIDTGPYGWDGDRRELRTHFARTVERLGGAGITAPEREALFAYIQSLSAPQAGVKEHAITARMQRGSELFHARETGCATCHLGDEIGTDREKHDVKSAVAVDSIKAFDTPSLRFIGRSAPYFHDGRYPTLLALIEGVDGTMGHTAQLSNEDRAALGAYLESL